MRRIVFFLLTNLAVLIVLGTVVRLLGLDAWFVQEDGRRTLDLWSLLLFAAVFGFLGSFLSLALSKWTAKRATGAVVITEPRSGTESWLLETVARQAAASGIDTPEVAVFASPDPNAFATGMRRNKALVAVSSGLLDTMDRREVEAVLAHEVSHVANGDMVTLSLLQGVLNTFVIFLSRVVGHLVDTVVFRNEERGPGVGYWIATILSEILFGVLASLVVFWYSRQREFRADAGAASLVGAGGMIAALERLQAHGTKALPQEVAAFGIAGSGRRAAALVRLLSTHPPLEARIEALRRAT